MRGTSQNSNCKEMRGIEGVIIISKIRLSLLEIVNERKLKLKIQLKASNRNEEASFEEGIIFSIVYTSII